MTNSFEHLTPIQRNGRLSVLNGSLVNSSKHPVILRGCSLFWSQWKPQFYNHELVEWLYIDWKIDVIRVAMAVDQGGYLSSPKLQLERVDAVVCAAIELGIYVIVDWHSHEKYLDDAAFFFETLCLKYGNIPNLIFELWNEPHEKYLWEKDIKPYHEHIVEIIRQHSPSSIIIAGTENFSKRVDISGLNPLNYNNILYSFHFYAASHKTKLRHLIQSSAEKKIPLIATEWGVCEANGNGKISFFESKKWLKLLEKYNISYLSWAISDKLEAASALKPNASATGKWHMSNLTKNGIFIRKNLRHKHS